MHRSYNVQCSGLFLQFTLSYGGVYQLPQRITGMNFQNVFVYKWQENSCAKSHAFVGKSQRVPADFFGIAYRNAVVYL